MIVGSAVARVIAWTPAPGMLNAIVCGPAPPLAPVTAWRSEPAPESSVLVTVKVAAWTEADATMARSETTDLRPNEGIRIGDSFFKAGGTGSLCRRRDRRRPPSRGAVVASAP